MFNLLNEKLVKEAFKKAKVGTIVDVEVYAKGTQANVVVKNKHSIYELVVTDNDFFSPVLDNGIYSIKVCRLCFGIDKWFESHIYLYDTDYKSLYTLLEL